MYEQRSERWIAASAAALLLQYCIQLAIGLFLAASYDPTVAGAHASVLKMRDWQFGLLANFHYWSSTILIAHSLLHLVAMLWTGMYRKPYVFHWLTAVVLFLTTMLYQLTGNLLPFDRHDVQTAVIESRIAAQAPGAGESVARAMLGGESFGQATLDTWLLAHKWLLLIPLAFALAGTASLAFRSKERRNFYVTIFPAAIAVILAGLVPAPSGASATAADFDATNAQVSWYTWPAHGALMTFEGIQPGLGWIGTVALPTALFGFLLLLPWLGGRLSQIGVRGVFSIFAVGYLGMALAKGGSFAPLTGNQDPARKEPVANAPKEIDPPIDQALVARGRALFEDEGCSGCHGKDGEKPTAGPNLRQVGREHTDPAWYQKFIRNPESVDPDSKMPAYEDLEEQKLRALAEFLRAKR